MAETLAGRRAEAERAEQLVVEEAERFREWQASLDVVPAIASLRARAEEIRAPSSRSSAAAVRDDERRTLESVTAQILNKLLHLPTVRMKEAAVAADGAAYADAVRHLFGLEDDVKARRVAPLPSSPRRVPARQAARRRAARRVEGGRCARPHRVARL